MPRSRETPKRSALAVSPAFRFRLAARPYRTARLVSASASRTPCSAISSSSSRLYSSIASSAPSVYSEYESQSVLYSSFASHRTCSHRPGANKFCSRSVARSYISPSTDVDL